MKPVKMKMTEYWGIDTSNYSTSVAYFRSDGCYCGETKLLPVPKGEKGLRQSDAVFHHVRQLPEVIQALKPGSPAAVGFSAYPRNCEGSYMPCFLAGKSFAQAAAVSAQCPLFCFSHQQGHIAAALLSSRKTDLLQEHFLAFHLSGGTMELVEVCGIQNIQPVCVTADVTAGQLIDRVGVSLGFSFPAGRFMSELAAQGKNLIRYPLKVKDGKVCLSGIENKAEQLLLSGEEKKNIAAFVMDTISQAVSQMILESRARIGSLPVIMVGGVSSSKILRNYLQGQEHVYFCEPELSKDNAVGIAWLTSLKANGELR